jgi:hypothetical protein
MARKILSALVLTMVTATGGGAAAIADLKSDWSDTDNPTSNGWSYRAGTNLLPHVDNWIGFGPGQPAWSPTSGGYVPAWFKATLCCGLDYLTGDIVVHTTDANGPGQGLANVVWTSALNGTIDISGNVWLARDEFDRSNVWRLLVNGTVISTGDLFAGDPFSRATPMDLALGTGGPAALLGIPVSIGDAIELQFEKTGSFGEFVGVNLTISREIGQVPEPSQAFVTAAAILAALYIVRHRERSSKAIRR